jgi:protein involved in plasmid replication-relaxation
MSMTTETLKGAEKILVALSEFTYLTAAQITKLLYAPSSHSYVQKQLKYLVAGKYVMPLAHRFVTQPRVYTVTGKGYSALKALGVPHQIRIRPREEKAKAHNFLFLQHTIAVTDVLIAARLLSQTVPDIALTRMYTERELKRTIYVEIPEKICIEPDASCEFEITVMSDGKPRTGVDFFHIEVYRNLPPVEWRFKQKIKGYVTYALTGQHEELFQTPALSIAVIAATDTQQATLRGWIEEALRDIGQPEEGEWFFFCSLDTASVTPEEMFLSPVWQQAFGTAKTPLIVLEEETEEAQTNQ